MAIINKLDHFGRGIIFDEKITFVNYALPSEEIDYQIIKKSKKYNLAQITNLKTKSADRVDVPCPYFFKCGGCALEHLKYSKNLEFKKEKVEEILNKYAKIKTNINVIENPHPYNYRNKLSLKIKNGKLGFYETKSHKLVEITQCLLAQESINQIIKDISYFHLQTANITFRTNYNNELLIIIQTADNINIDLPYLTQKHKIVGIIINDAIFYGEDKFIEKVANRLFQVSYNSFFQVNPYVTTKIFEIVTENVQKDSIVTDLYCGVGTLGIVAAQKACQVYGIEIVPNAIKNALINKKINKCSNIEFCLGDAKEVIDKIKAKIDTIIIDPPRNGLSQETLNNILKITPKDLIYISCDPMTLARDLKILKERYIIKKIYIADMFSYTYHVETVCILSLQ